MYIEFLKHFLTQNDFNNFSSQVYDISLFSCTCIIHLHVYVFKFLAHPNCLCQLEDLSYTVMHELLYGTLWISILFRIFNTPGLTVHVSFSDHPSRRASSCLSVRPSVYRSVRLSVLP